jgi:hypothetical protein
MFIRSFAFLFLVAAFAGGCAFQHGSESLLPAAPSAAGGTSVAAVPGAQLASFVGANWALSSIAGLPSLTSCSEPAWTVVSQTTSSVMGNFSAVCSGGSTASGTLTGQMNGSDRINVTAAGSAVIAGVTCAFNLTGIASKVTNDTTRLEYSGSTCAGPVSGTEILDRGLPQIP